MSNIKIKEKIKKAIILVSLISSGSLFAGLQIESSAVEISKKDSINKEYNFSQVGLSPDEPRLVKGFGKGMPLDLSLRIIVPKGFRVNLNEEAKNKKVDWEGKNSWPYALEDLAMKNKLDISIDWKKRTVDVFSEKEYLIVKARDEKIILAAKEEKAAIALKIRNEKAKRVFQDKLVATGNKNGVDTSNVNGSKDLKKLFNEINIRPTDGKLETLVDMIYENKLDENTELVFILESNKTLSENIAMWSQYVNWDLKWNATFDFPISKNIEIKGTLLEAVDQVTKMYQVTSQPLKAKIYVKNKVVEIINFNYKK
jgi:hypothetical protein